MAAERTHLPITYSLDAFGISISAPSAPRTRGLRRIQRASLSPNPGNIFLLEHRTKTLTNHYFTVVFINLSFFSAKNNFDEVDVICT